jgi:hypothetical protein
LANDHIRLGAGHRSRGRYHTDLQQTVIGIGGPAARMTSADKRQTEVISTKFM